MYFEDKASCIHLEITHGTKEKLKNDKLEHVKASAWEIAIKQIYNLYISALACGK